MSGPQQPQVVCPNCRGGNAPNAMQCQWCGYQLQVAPQQMPPQPIYVQIPQPPPKQRSVVWPIVAVILVVGCLGCAGLFALGVFTTPTATTVSTSSGTSSTSSTARIGDTVAIGSWQVRVEKTEATKQFDWSGFGNMQTAKGVYLLVYVDALNTTSKPDQINYFDYKVTDSTGAQYDACTEFACLSYPDQIKRDSFTTDVPPRTHTPLLAIFDVAPDAKGLTLEIEHSAKIATGNLPAVKDTK